MVSVPTRGPQPQPPSPMESPTVAFRREPVPVTSTKDEPSTLSPMKATLVLTTPPPDIVSVPSPPVVPPPTERPNPPIFHCDPAPVTTTVAGPPKKESTSAPPWLLSTPPLLMVSAPGPKRPMPVKPPAATVTVEPGPEITMSDATSRSPKMPLVGPTCSVPPLMTESVPPSTVTPWAKPLTVSEPPSMVSEPVEQRQRSRSPSITLPVPVNLNDAASSSSMEPGPLMTPEKVVLVLPAMNRRVLGSDAPSCKAPAPASEPISTDASVPDRQRRATADAEVRHERRNVAGAVDGERRRVLNRERIGGCRGRKVDGVDRGVVRDGDRRGRAIICERRRVIGHGRRGAPVGACGPLAARTGPGAVDRMRGAWAQHRQRADAHTPEQCRARRRVRAPGAAIRMATSPIETPDPGCSAECAVRET